MAADQDRAERIHKLKRERPDLTWRAIADYVGTSERAAIDWAKNGGIAYDNAKKLAALFEVDVDYIWRGPADTGTPDPFKLSDEDVAVQLGEIRTRIDELSGLLAENNRLLKALAVGPVPLPSGTLGRVLRGEPTTPPTEKPARRQAGRAARANTSG